MKLSLKDKFDSILRDIDEMLTPVASTVQTKVEHKEGSDDEPKEPNVNH